MGIEDKEKSFKEKVTEAVIACAAVYQEKFVQYDYLVCSKAFEGDHCQIIKAEPNNFLHLTGLNTKLSADEFYQKCLNKSLNEDDFDFVKKGQSEKSVKGSVRQKMKALPAMLDMFDKQLIAEQNFRKNNICCIFATAESSFTIGFVETGRPKSLMRKNQLSEGKSEVVDLVLRKRREDTLFSERIYGGAELYEKYKKDIAKYIDG